MTPTGRCAFFDSMLVKAFNVTLDKQLLYQPADMMYHLLNSAIKQVKPICPSSGIFGLAGEEVYIYVKYVTTSY